MGARMGGVEQGTQAVGAIRHSRYRRGEWMTREDTKAIFPVATKGPAAAQWRGQAVHIILTDDRAGGRGMVEVEVLHGQGAGYQYNVLVPNVVVTTAAAAGMEVRIGLSWEGQAIQVYTMGHWEGRLIVQWTAEPACREPLHAEGQVGRGRAVGEDTAELGRAEHEKEKRHKGAATEGLDVLGDGRDRREMLRKWAQRLRGKATAWQNVLIENREAQPGLEERIKGWRDEEVRTEVSNARFHLKARADRWPGACAGWMGRKSPKKDTVGSECGSPGDKGPSGYRWQKMMGRHWCTSTKSSTCCWDMRMVGAEPLGRMQRRVRDRRKRRCSRHGRWSQSRQYCGCR